MCIRVTNMLFFNKSPIGGTENSTAHEKTHPDFGILTESKTVLIFEHEGTALGLLDNSKSKRIQNGP